MLMNGENIIPSDIQAFLRLSDCVKTQNFRSTFIALPHFLRHVLRSHAAAPSCCSEATEAALKGALLLRLGWLGGLRAAAHCPPSGGTL
ncbi:hypothetical protein LDENG_00189440 [Lucifuga dentata]|nr:hypothetical protein LDENG_00189440 [Lucifuga dentata]